MPSSDKAWPGNKLCKFSLAGLAELYFDYCWVHLCFKINCPGWVAVGGCFSKGLFIEHKMGIRDLK